MYVYSVDVNQSPNVQDTFWPMPGLISCAGVTGSVGITRHAHATQMAGLSSSQSHNPMYSALQKRLFMSVCDSLALQSVF